MKVQIIKKVIKNNFVLISLLLLFVFVLWNGISGVDFGQHWDEHLFTTAVTRTLKTGIPLPKMYTYPSLCYHFALISIMPDLIHAKFIDVSKDSIERLIAFSQSYSFALRLRIIFFIIASLSLFWVYGLVLIWRKSRLEALLSASFLGLSWEFIYHARFAMTDAITMQFCILTIFCLFLYLNSKGARFLLKFTAVIAGLTFGSKYHGVAIIIPVILAIYLFPRKNTKKIGSLFYESFIVLLIFGFTYLFTTPGMILDPFKFLTYVWSTGIQNKEMGFWGYTTTSQLEHLSLILRYFSFAVFSKYSIVSSILFLMSLVGLVVMFKEERRKAILFTIFPILFLIYMSSLKAMIIRNYLLLFPFFAILASRGCIYIFNKVKYHSLPRLLFSLLIALLLLVNASWLVKSTLSIKDRKTTNYIKQLVTFIDKYPAMHFFVSKKIAVGLEHFDNKIRENVILENSKGVKAAIFYASEIDDWRKFLANRHDYTWTWFGPYEINYNYYPTWVPEWGVNDRIVVMPTRYFNMMKVFAGPDEVMLLKEWEKLKESIFK